MARDFPKNVRLMNITSLLACVRAPEANGMAQWFGRLLNENLLWVRVFATMLQDPKTRSAQRSPLDNRSPARLDSNQCLGSRGALQAGLVMEPAALLMAKTRQEQVQ